MTEFFDIVHGVRHSKGHTRDERNKSLTSTYSKGELAGLILDHEETEIKARACVRKAVTIRKAHRRRVQGLVNRFDKARDAWEEKEGEKTHQKLQELKEALEALPVKHGQYCLGADRFGTCNCEVAKVLSAIDNF
jgi:hypothetical protein